MKWLDNLRQKPLNYRKKIIGIASGITVITLLLVSILVFKEWRWPEIKIDEITEIQDVVDNTKVATENLKKDLEDFEEFKEKLETEAVAEEVATDSSLVKAKNNVEVSITSWERQGERGIVTMALRNLATEEATLKSFSLFQGTAKIDSPREITLAPQQDKEVEISFILEGDKPVSGFEIGQASFTNLDASAADLESWNYLFRIEDDTANEDAETPVEKTDQNSEEVPAEKS